MHHACSFLLMKHSFRTISLLLCLPLSGLSQTSFFPLAGFSYSQTSWTQSEQVAISDSAWMPNLVLGGGLEQALGKRWRISFTGTADIFPYRHEVLSFGFNPIFQLNYSTLNWSVFSSWQFLNRFYLSAGLNGRYFRKIYFQSLVPTENPVYQASHSIGYSAGLSFEVKQLGIFLSYSGFPETLSEGQQKGTRKWELFLFYRLQLLRPSGKRSKDLDCPRF